jgi:hypothetical protein
MSAGMTASTRAELGSTHGLRSSIFQYAALQRPTAIGAREDGNGL